MVAVPAPVPVTIPDIKPAVATAVLLLVHDPPVIVFVNVVVAPAHMFLVPLIAVGPGLTVTTVVILHPVASV